MRREATGRDPTDCVHCATRQACLVSRLADADLAELQPDIRKRSLRRGESLATEGELAHEVRVLKVGTVFGYRNGLDGRPRPIGMAGRGATFGVFGVFGLRTQTSAVAAASGRVCDIPVRGLRRIASRDNAYADYLSNAAVDACGRIASWSEAMRVRGLTNQLAYSLLLLANAEGHNVVELPTHTALAELLGSTRETVARALSTLEAEGCIRRGDRKKCEVLREPVLQRLASGRPDDA